MNFPITHFNLHEKTPFPISEWILNLDDPPSSIFIQGSKKGLKLLSKLPERGLAIVGTRNPLLKSKEQLRRWILELQGSQLILISGLARGIDTLAHLTALEAGLPTIAILGAGLDLPYPKENQVLKRQILQSDGLLISEYPLGTPALGHHFLRRNRLIAGFSQATWVVEAGLPSGALNTARWTREQNKICFAVPCSPGDPAFAGNQTLLDRDHSLTFWGIHSLGAVWLELATHPTCKQKNSCQKKTNQAKNHPLSSPINPLNPHEKILVEMITQLTHQTGGVPLQEVLEWALQQSWTAHQFFSVLQPLLEKNCVREHRGLLVSL